MAVVEIRHFKEPSSIDFYEMIHSKISSADGIIELFLFCKECVIECKFQVKIDERYNYEGGIDTVQSFLEQCIKDAIDAKFPFTLEEHPKGDITVYYLNEENEKTLKEFRGAFYVKQQ